MASVLRAPGATAARAGSGAEAVKRIAEQAEARAQEILRTAAEESERIRSAAREEGSRLGLARAQELLAAAEEERRRTLAALEVDLAGLALAVAEKILGRAVEEGGLAREMARRALARLPAAEEVAIRANPADVPSLQCALPALEAAAPQAGRLTVREDAEVGRGGAVVESATASVDARVEAQLAELGRALGGGG